MTGLSNGDALCLLWGKYWIFIYWGDIHAGKDEYNGCLKENIQNDVSKNVGC